MAATIGMDLDLRSAIIGTIAVLIALGAAFGSGSNALIKGHALDSTTAAAQTANEIGIAAAAAIACDASIGSGQSTQTATVEGQSVSVTISGPTMTVTVGTGGRGFVTTEPVATQCHEPQKIDVGGGS